MTSMKNLPNEDSPKYLPNDEPKAEKCKCESSVAAGDKPENAALVAAQNEELNRYPMEANDVDVSLCSSSLGLVIILWAGTMPLIEYHNSIALAPQ